MSRDVDRRSVLALGGAGLVGGTAALSRFPLARGGANDGSNETDAPSSADAPSASIAGWSQYRGGPGYRGYTAGSDAPTADFEPRWGREWIFPDAGEWSESLTEPAVVDGTVYVGASDGRLRALDAETGETRWSRAVYPLDTPAVAADAVFVGCEDGVRELDAETGETRWTFDEYWYGIDWLAFDGERVYAGDYRDSEHADGEYGRPYAIDPVDGSLVWRQDQYITTQAFGGVAAGTVFTVSLGVNGLDAETGEIGEPLTVVNDEYGTRAQFSRVAGTESTAFVSTSDGAFGIDIETGEIRWQVERDGDRARPIPAVDGAKAYLSLDAEIRAVGAETGETEWIFDDAVSGHVDHPLTVTDAAVYAVAGDDEFGEVELIVLDADDGTVLGRQTVPGSGDGERPLFGPVVSEETVYLGTVGANDGATRLYALQAADGTGDDAPFDDSNDGREYERPDGGSGDGGDSSDGSDGGDGETDDGSGESDGTDGSDCPT